MENKKITLKGIMAKEKIFNMLQLEENKLKIKSKNYNVGEYIECLLDDRTNVLWEKDNVSFKDGSDSKVYGSIKSDNCTLCQWMNGEKQNIKTMTDYFFNNNYDNTFTYVKVFNTGIEIKIWTKEEFKKIVEKYAKLSTTSTKGGKYPPKTNLKLNLGIRIWENL